MPGPLRGGVSLYRGELAAAGTVNKYDLAFVLNFRAIVSASKGDL
jgi:hypothetical protein